MKIIATYSFLPWLRQGVANTITAADGDTTIKTRATINVALQLSGQPVGGGAPLTQGLSQSIALYGPGDIVGIDSRAIVRLEPRNWITNFESNYFPAIDFYDEDFPWRYTPATPDGTGLRLRPWIHGRTECQPAPSAVRNRSGCDRVSSGGSALGLGSRPFQPEPFRWAP
jgi:hypothetical protein